MALCKEKSMSKANSCDMLFHLKMVGCVIITSSFGSVEFGNQNSWLQSHLQ